MLKAISACTTQLGLTTGCRALIQISLAALPKIELKRKLLAFDSERRHNPSPWNKESAGE
jgi:hypothetical protein